MYRGLKRYQFPSKLPQPLLLQCQFMKKELELNFAHVLTIHFAYMNSKTHSMHRPVTAMRSRKYSDVIVIPRFVRLYEEIIHELHLCYATIISVDLAKYVGTPVAQWVKRWPTDLVVPSSSPARGEIFPTVNGVPLHTAFHYLPLVVLI